MRSHLDDLHRFGLEIFIQPDTVPAAADLIPVFHRWIQNRSLEGLLIDVADYGHLTDGPRVSLIGHEGNLSLHVTTGRVGLLYTAKRIPDPSFPVRLKRVAHRLLSAADLLAQDESLRRPPAFSSGELEFLANDRLVALRAASSVELLRPALHTLMDHLYPEGSHQIAVVGDDRERLRLSLRSDRHPPLTELRARAA